MNRYHVTPLLAVVTLVAVACQDAQQPQPPANFQVSDASEFGGSNGKHFFFLPPIVPSPTFSGTFDATLLPYLSVRVTGPWGVYPDDSGALCAITDDPVKEVVTIRQADGLALSTVNEQYAYGLRTGDYALEDGQVYRVCVFLDVPNVPSADPALLGFRDVSPRQGGGSVAEDPIYLFNNGSTLALKFRAEVGVLSDAFCTGEPDPQDPNGYDCTAKILASGESAFCDNFTCVVTAGDIPDDESELFIVEKFGLGDTECTDQGVTNWLAVDIPQWAGCVRVSVPNPSFAGFETSLQNGILVGRGIVGACFYEETGPELVKTNQLDGSQDESIQLHIQYPDARVWALPWQAAGIEGTCEMAWPELAASQATSPMDRMMRLAKRTLRRAQLAFNPLFAPVKAYAFHTGFGGHTSLSPTESSPDLSPSGLRLDDGNAAVTAGEITDVNANQVDGEQVFLLAWALPSQMTGTASSGSQSVPPGGTLVVGETDAVSVEVLVTDNGAAGTPRVATTPGRPVQGATVRFAIDGGTETLVESNSAGGASFSAPPLSAGPHTITASGFGIGTAATGGPFDSFGPNGQYNDLAAELFRGTLTFNVFVCSNNSPGFWNGDINDRAGATPFNFPVNLGGKVTDDAYLFVGNDCENLYLALAVPVDESTNNSVRFVFDNTYPIATLGPGSESADDDILGINKVPLGTPLSVNGWLPRDRYLSAACLGSKQADCGPDDLPNGGSRDVTGSATWQGSLNLGGARTGYFVYSLSHPLASGDDGFDFQRTFGQTTGFYLAVSLGTGTKANVEWPTQNGRFKTYQGYMIVGPTLTP